MATRDSMRQDGISVSPNSYTESLNSFGGGAQP